MILAGSAGSTLRPTTSARWVPQRVVGADRGRGSGPRESTVATGEEWTTFGTKYQDSTTVVVLPETEDRYGPIDRSLRIE